MLYLSQAIGRPVRDEVLNRPIAKQKDDGNPKQRPGEENAPVHLLLATAERLMTAWQPGASPMPPPDRLYRLS